jgi:hypothetical protein
MFAIMILGVGLTMAAALFPAAMKINHTSTAGVIGEIAAENGLAVAKARLAHPLFPPVPTDRPLTEVTATVGANNLKYPLPETGHAGDPWKRGCVVLARPVRQPVANDYLLVVVSYTKTAESAQAKVEQLNCTVETGKTEFTVAGSDRDKLEKGAPVIGRGGEWARIVDVDFAAGTAFLDRPLNTALAGGQDVKDPFIVHEEGPGELVGTYVLMTRTGLK